MRAPSAAPPSMANQPADHPGRAGALEASARAYHDRACTWDASLGQRVGQSVDDSERAGPTGRDWDRRRFGAGRAGFRRTLESISGARPREAGRPLGAGES